LTIGAIKENMIIIIILQKTQVVGKLTRFSLVETALECTVY